MAEGDTAIADVLLAADGNAQYLLGRLVQGDDKWEAITNGALMKLGRQYGAVTVREALGYMREEEGAGAETPYALLEAVCKRIRRERG